MNKIREALDWFGPNGERWGKGSIMDTRGNACILGALREVGTVRMPCYSINKGVTTTPEYRHIAATIREQYGERCGVTHIGIGGFNDHPDTTWPDVERIMEKAA